MPGYPQGGGSGGAAMRTPGGARGFTRPVLAERNYTISGVTQDATGLPLGGCIVKLYNAATDQVVAQTVSSSVPGSIGAYSFAVDKTQLYYEVSYKAGPPDVYGTSLNTLQGV